MLKNWIASGNIWDNMEKHKCWWCGNYYLISNLPCEISEVRRFYLEHLKKGCNPTFEHTFKKMLTAMADVQRDFVA